jgi:hypothetical protein
MPVTVEKVLNCHALGERIGRSTASITPFGRHQVWQQVLPRPQTKISLMPKRPLSF